MSAADFLRVAKQLIGIVERTIEPTMQRIVLQGEAIMKREMPVKRGALRRSATGKVELRGRRGRVGTNIGYARGVNDGTRPHRITARNAKALKTPYGYFKSVNHPGNRPNDYLGRTRDRLRPVAEREMGSEFGSVLGKVH